jgi:hypothetical protein
MTPNTFPAPIGVTVSFPNVQGGVTTPSFTWAEPGLYCISLEFADEDKSSPPQCTFQVSGGAALITMQRSGYYNFAVPQGGATYTFTAVTPVKNVRMTRMF